MKKYIKRLLLFIASGAASVFLAACYGVPIDYDTTDTWPNRIRLMLQNKKYQSIPNIAITGSWLPDGLKTDEFGEVDLPTVYLSSYLSSATITLRDTDGAANGGDFGTSMHSLSKGSEYVYLRLSPLGSRLAALRKDER